MPPQTIAEATASVVVVDLHPGVDAEVRVDADNGEIPILTISTASGEWLISPSDTRPGPADLLFADALVAAATRYRDELRRLS